MSKKSVGIIGIGASLPDKIVTNKDLEDIVDTSDEWIKKRTGIEERRVLDDGQNLSDLGAQAGIDAITDAGIDPDDIDMIIVATGSPELIWPSTACLIQQKMGIKGQPAFDLQAACTGFTYGVDIASQLVGSGTYKNVLLIGAEAMTRYVDWSDRSTCILFGDGAAAVVIGGVEEGLGIISSDLGADGSGSDLLTIPKSGSAVKHGRHQSVVDQTIKMNGGEVFKFAVRVIVSTVEDLIEKSGIKLEEISRIVPHQANKRITYSAAEKLGISREIMVSNIAKYGNTGSASIPLALFDLNRDGRLQKGDIFVTVGFGAGLTWGSNLIKWSKHLNR